ncbi:hypothetical protein M011DRAFT_428592, partial [Sporormia fimetaria CBS 119925]
MQQQNPTYITPSTSPRSGSGERQKPTLLAFHGSGSNGTIHTVQLARLTRLLKPHFDIKALDAPFASAAGPGILPFFEGCGPFHRWLPPSEKLTLNSMKRGEASGTMAPEVESLISATCREIQASGSKVVGVVGFSQGTRVVAGILKGVQLRGALREEGGEGEWLDGIKFGMSVCASYPPPLLPEVVVSALDKLGDEERKEKMEEKIKMPTLHVQGKQDEWAWAGEALIKGFYDEGESEVLELDMGHHYPVAVEENERIARWVVDVWTG